MFVGWVEVGQAQHNLVLLGSRRVSELILTMYNKGEEETVKVTWTSEKDLQQELENPLGRTARLKLDSQTAIDFRTTQGKALLELIFV